MSERWHSPTEPRGLPVLIAGGEGRRLRPITSVLPKPLIPVDGVPIILNILHRLDSQGFLRAVVATGYLGHLIRAVVEQESFDSLSIEFFEESQPLGTAGILKRVMDDMKPSYVIAINADTLSDIEFDRIALPEGVHGQMLVTRIRQQSKHGHVDVDSLQRVVRLSENPVTEHLVSIGVNAFSREVVGLIERDERIDVPTLVERAIGKGLTIAAAEHLGQWTDLGTFDDLEGILSRFSDG